MTHAVKYIRLYKSDRRGGRCGYQEGHEKNEVKEVHQNDGQDELEILNQYILWPFDPKRSIMVTLQTVSGNVSDHFFLVFREHRLSPLFVYKKDV